VIKGCNILGLKIGNNCSFMGGYIIVQQEKISRAEIIFQNPKNYSLGDVQRFCYHFLCDSMVIYNSSNAYLSLSQFWTATSRHLPPAPFHLKIMNTTHKHLIRSQPHSHNTFAPTLVFLLQKDWL
jgi:hypothetical protein